jgi:hypothetical protein
MIEGLRDKCNDTYVTTPALYSVCKDKVALSLSPSHEDVEILDIDTEWR